jgi:hypothetical protein
MVIGRRLTTDKTQTPHYKIVGNRTMWWALVFGSHEYTWVDSDKLIKYELYNNIPSCCSQLQQAVEEANTLINKCAKARIKHFIVKFKSNSAQSTNTISPTTSASNVKPMNGKNNPYLLTSVTLAKQKNQNVFPLNNAMTSGQKQQQQQQQQQQQRTSSSSSQSNSNRAHTSSNSLLSSLKSKKSNNRNLNGADVINNSNVNVDVDVENVDDDEEDADDKSDYQSQMRKLQEELLVLNKKFAELANTKPKKNGNKSKGSNSSFNHSIMNSSTPSGTPSKMYFRIIQCQNQNW